MSERKNKKTAEASGASSSAPAANSARVGTTPSKRAYGGMSATARAQQRRARLVAAGMSLFVEKGIEHTTIADVCKAAGVAKRYFYDEFDGIAPLFDAVYMQVNSELLRVLMVHLAQGGNKPLELIEKLVSAFYGFISDGSGRGKIMMVEARKTAYGVMERIWDNSGVFTTLIKSYYPGADKAGYDIPTLVFGMINLIVGVGHAWVQDDFRTPIETMVRHAMLPFHALDEWHERHMN